MEGQDTLTLFPVDGGRRKMSSWKTLKHNINIITNSVVQTADQGAHTPTALYFITFWVSMYPERKQLWTKKKQKKNTETVIQPSDFVKKTIFTFLNSALRCSDNMEKCEPSHRRLLTWVRLTPSVWHMWKADHAYVPTHRQPKKSHILGKRQSSSIHLRNIRFNTGGVSPTSPFPIFWEFRSFTSTQRAASAAAGGETLLQFKVG